MKPNRKRRGGRNHEWAAPMSRAAIFQAGGFKRVTINHPPIRTLLDMSEDEILKLELHYGVPVIRPLRTASGG